MIAGLMWWLKPKPVEAPTVPTLAERREQAKRNATTALVLAAEHERFAAMHDSDPCQITGFKRWSIIRVNPDLVVPEWAKEFDGTEYEGCIDPCLPDAPMGDMWLHRLARVRARRAAQ